MQLEGIFKEFIEMKHSYPNAALLTLGALVTNLSAKEMNNYYLESPKGKNNEEDIWSVIGFAIDKMDAENELKKNYSRVKNMGMRDFEAVPIAIGLYKSHKD